MPVVKCQHEQTTDKDGRCCRVPAGVTIPPNLDKSPSGWPWPHDDLFDEIITVAGNQPGGDPKEDCAAWVMAQPECQADNQRDYGDGVGIAKLRIRDHRVLKPLGTMMPKISNRGVKVC